MVILLNEYVCDHLGDPCVNIFDCKYHIQMVSLLNEYVRDHLSDPSVKMLHRTDHIQMFFPE